MDFILNLVCVKRHLIPDLGQELSNSLNRNSTGTSAIQIKYIHDCGELMTDNLSPQGKQYQLDGKEWPCLFWGELTTVTSADPQAYVCDKECRLRLRDRF